MINLKRYITISEENFNIDILPIRADYISIIIPAKDDQPRLDNLLRSLSKAFNQNLSPLEVIVVDNNSSPKLEINWSNWKTKVPIQMIICKKSGASAARNFGVSVAKGNWLLFCDHDCIATPQLLKGYLKAENNSIAYAGFVKSLGKDPISNYYESQNVLHPPEAFYENHIEGPMYVVAANALVLKRAFEKVGGFNEKFKCAAEDVDLSLRLWQIGKISHAKESVVLHDFKNDWKDFCRRFTQYGFGNWQLQLQYHVHKFPKLVCAKKPSFFNYLAASIHWICLVNGYCHGRFLTSYNHG